MKIEVWLDFTCPFCYIAKKRLEKAIDQFVYKGAIDVVYKSYLINPLLDKTIDIDANQALALHKDITIEEAIKIHDRIALTAFDEEIVINFDLVKTTSTIRAHQLLKLAKTSEDKKTLSNLLYRGYFELGEDIFDIKTLVKYGESIGLNEKDIIEVLSDNTLISAIEFDNDEAVSYGITGVPFFVIDQTYSLSGAQKTEVFKEMLYRVHEHTVQERKKKITKTEYCVGDDCDYVPKLKKE